MKREQQCVVYLLLIYNTFDKWSKNEQFIDDLITMLDNVIQHFIDNAIDTTQLGEYNANFKRFEKHIKEGTRRLY